MFNDFVEQGFHDMCLVWCLNFLLGIILQARGKGIRYLCEADTEWNITCASWSWGKQGQEWTTGWLPSDNSPAPVYDDHHIIRWWRSYYHEDPTYAICWPDPHLKLTSTWISSTIARYFQPAPVSFQFHFNHCSQNTSWTSRLVVALHSHLKNILTSWLNVSSWCREQVLGSSKYLCFCNLPHLIPVLI